MTDLGREGRDPLHYTAKNDDVDGVRERLAAGVDVNMAETRSGYTPVHFAVQGGRRGQRTAGRGADVQAVHTPGATPLHLAVIRWSKSPNGQMIKLLPEHGADKAVAETNGHTPAGIATATVRIS